MRDVGKAEEYNGQERQEASEFSRVTSIPRDGAWTQMWGLLARRLEGSWSWAKSWWSGGWEQGTLQGTRSGTLSPTHCTSPQTQGFLRALSVPLLGRWLPPWPGRKVGNHETDCSLTWHPRPQRAWELIGFTLFIWL